MADGEIVRVPASVATDVTLGEVFRALADLREEIRALRGEHVRRDLYEAQLSETRAHLDRLEERLATQDDERRTWRRQITLAGLAAVLSLAVAVVTALLR